MIGSLRRFFFLFCAWTCLGPRLSEAQPFTVQGPGVNPSHFRVTTFASGLDYPLGMAELPDGSLLVALSQGANYFNSSGRITRFADTNLDGVADGPGTVLYSGLPGGQTSLRVGGSLVFVTGQRKPVSVLRLGGSPSASLSLVGQIHVQYPGAWYHPHSALGIRKSPGRTNAYDLLFQLGSDSNLGLTTRTAILTNDRIPGASGTLAGDSAYMLTVIDHGSQVTATNLTHLASGLRNAAGFAFHPATGDLYLQDNGIDGFENPNEPVSADELNFIARNRIGVTKEDFGFPTTYVAYRNGTQVGDAGTPPLVAFQPIPSPSTGRESEGANDITFAPPGFPTGLNTGIFVGFHGRFGGGGVNNEENPVVYVDVSTGSYFHFIAGQQVGIGHFDGLLATRDSLFLADLCSNGSLSGGAGTGAIYQIQSLVHPRPHLSARWSGGQLELSWDRGALQQAQEPNGSWTELSGVFSPLLIELADSQGFYRAAY